MDATEVLRVFMRANERAMEDEGVATAVRERVANRIIWGDPEGYVAVRRVPDAEEIVVPADVTARIPEIMDPLLLGMQSAGPQPVTPSLRPSPDPR